MRVKIFKVRKVHSAWFYSLSPRSSVILSCSFLALFHLNDNVDQDFICCSLQSIVSLGLGTPLFSGLLLDCCVNLPLLCDWWSGINWFFFQSLNTYSVFPVYCCQWGFYTILCFLCSIIVAGWRCPGQNLK
jgi:hypothetical protein